MNFLNIQTSLLNIRLISRCIKYMYVCVSVSVYVCVYYIYIYIIHTHTYTHIDVYISNDTLFFLAYNTYAFLLRMCTYMYVKKCVYRLFAFYMYTVPAVNFLLWRIFFVYYSSLRVPNI